MDSVFQPLKTGFEIGDDPISDSRDPRPRHLLRRTFSGRSLRLVGGDHATTHDLKNLHEDDRPNASLVACADDKSRKNMNVIFSNLH
jgi:hypothetical protein